MVVAAVPALSNCSRVLSLYKLAKKTILNIRICEIERKKMYNAENQAKLMEVPPKLAPVSGKN